jgi:hypothetical protein
MQAAADPMTIGRLITQARISRARRVYNGEIPMGLDPMEDEVAALHFIVSEQKAQIASENQALEQHRQEADTSSQRRADLTSLYSSGVTQRSWYRSILKDDRHRLPRNLEADFIDVEIFPKTRDVVIMATAAYITAKASNDIEHMAKLRAYA